MFEQLKNGIEKITYWQYVIIFLVLAFLRILYLPERNIIFLGDNWVAAASLGLALMVLLYRTLIVIKIKFFAQRLLAIASLLAAIALFGTYYYLYFFFLAFGVGMLRKPLTETDQGLGWKFELPLVVVLFANMWLGKQWLFIMILGLTVLNEFFGKPLKKRVSAKLMP